PLQVAPGTGNLTLVASGDTWVNVVGGGIDATKLSVQGSQTVGLSTSAGSIELDGDSFQQRTLSFLSVTALGAGSNITFGDTKIAADELHLLAAGNIGESDNPIFFAAQQLRTLSAGSQYLAVDGSTTVQAIQSFGEVSLQSGDFLVAESGFIFATQTVTVETAALLGGDGKISANLVLVRGVLSPGNFEPAGTRENPIDGDASVLTIFGNVTVTDTGQMVFDVNPPYETAGTDYDQVIVNGTLTLGDPDDPSEPVGNDGPLLVLRGGATLQQSIQGLQLVTGNVQGMFRIDDNPLNPLSIDKRTGGIKATVGNFTGSLLVNVPTPGLLIGELTLVPPIQRVIFKPPTILIPVFTSLVRLQPPVQPPPPLTPPSQPPPLEFKTQAVRLRYLEIRLVVPNGDGSFREEFVMNLSADMLTDLLAVFRRLPDDRYRVYLMLAGNAEERLVIDVLVRDGKPVEPLEQAGDEAAPEMALPPVPAAPPAPVPHQHHEGTSGPMALPPLPAAADVPMPLGYDQQPAEHFWTPAEQPAAGRLFAGVGLAAAAIAAGRSPGRWKGQVEQAAARIGASPAHWRWWRKSA
ncbi:MAG TPA: hypothetical protein VFB80_19750, partial [Pirellulaceae bacterium]|nr:hypothetical protein [Pirellulaceae bacterium]